MRYQYDMTDLYDELDEIVSVALETLQNAADEALRPLMDKVGAVPSIDLHSYLHQHIQVYEFEPSAVCDVTRSLVENFNKYKLEHFEQVCKAIALVKDRNHYLLSEQAALDELIQYAHDSWPIPDVYGGCAIRCYREWAQAEMERLKKEGKTVDLHSTTYYLVYE